MRIVIDLQGAQSDASREKNIGKFSLLLAHAIVRNRGAHEVFIALNGLFPESVERICDEFFGLLPRENIRVWHTLAPVTYGDINHTVLRKTAEHIRECFLASLQPDIVYVTSLFEGLGDNAVTSIGQFTQAFPTAVTLFDLITSGDKKEYLVNPSVASWYENKTGHMMRADLCLAISSNASLRGIEQLGLPKDKVFDMGVVGSEPISLMVGGFEKAELKEYCPDERLFWEEAAQRAIAAFEWCVEKRKVISAVKHPARRPKLAYVSPLPPERSGISDYSVEILPDLARHYEIDVIVNQGSVSDVWVNANCVVRNADWLLNHANEYDRVLYHFGNSYFHQHMFQLLARVPGVVVLHDFFLSDIVLHMDSSGYAPMKWVQELYDSFGYRAVQDRAKIRVHEDTLAIVSTYPCNYSVISQALGVVSHSEHSKQLAQVSYGASISGHWSVVPLPRANHVGVTREFARVELGIEPDDFVVSSFGLLGRTKLNHRLLDAWLASSLSKNSRCRLVFVGQNDPQEYGEELTGVIERSGIADRISITGWASATQYQQHLAAADIGVQLRASSRGETSAAVLDCINYGLATIVNANGSMAELSGDAVLKLPDAFTDVELQDALETLWQNEKQLRALSEKGRELIMNRHAPSSCADLYMQAIEGFYEQAQHGVSALAKKIVGIDGVPCEEGFLQPLSKVFAKNTNKKATKKQLLIDISAIVQNDLKTGIQRVVRALLVELIKSPPEGYRIEPVYMTDEGGFWHLRYARRYTLGLLDCPTDWLEDEQVETMSGDKLLTLDLTMMLVAVGEKAGFYRDLKTSGVELWFVIYDLLPILVAEKFPPESSPIFREWLMSVCRSADGVICISRAVADELTDFVREADVKRIRPLKPHWFHLGADVSSSAPTRGLPDDAAGVLAKLAERPTFLMVGTVEPRKGQAQALKSFELLWKQGADVNLVIVGKQGWMMESLIDDIKAHEELDKRLFWMAGISDEYLEKLYSAASCLIAASEGEGFGLPLIEAAQYKVPLLVRDIPVFCEVAGEHASYFSGLQDKDLAYAVTDWLKLNSLGKAPQSTRMPWLTWQQSAQQLLDAMLHRTVVQPIPVVAVSETLIVPESLLVETVTRKQEPHKESVTQQQTTQSAELKPATPANYSTAYKGQAGKSNKRNKSR